jgi:hypothetical protein
MFWLVAYTLARWLVPKMTFLRQGVCSTCKIVRTLTDPASLPEPFISMHLLGLYHMDN